MVSVTAIDADGDNSKDSVDVKFASDKIVEVLSERRCQYSLLDRKAYEKRLVSFQASTFYAKPACLSPLFCARFGWENADKDMLVCTSCNAALAITLNSKLSANTFDKLCHAYRTKIVCSHDNNCPFRLSSIEKLEFLEIGEKTESENDEAETRLTVPVYMGQVLPEGSIRLMEHPKPCNLLKQNARQLMDAVESAASNEMYQITATGDGGASKWSYPSLQIPLKIQQMDTDLVLTKMLGCDDISVLALSVLGWCPIPNTSCTTKSKRVVSLGCPLCLAMMDLEVEQQQQQQQQTSEDGNVEEGDDSDASEPDRVTKRQRMNSRKFNPLEAHRHYCPIKVGFPKKSTDTNPVWKIILERLANEQKDEEVVKKQPTTSEKADETTRDSSSIGMMDKSIENVRRILRAGIAQTQVDLTA